MSEETGMAPSSPPTEPEPNPLSVRELGWAALGIAALTIAMYGDVLLSLGDTVVSHPLGDTALYFAPFREFGFAEMAKGNLVLWNPHIFAGAPFFGGFQSALLYPLNAMYLLLPLPFALNFDICLHTFLLGMFMYAWVRVRNLHAAAAFFAAGVIMFCGPYALRVLAGQLTMLSGLAYTPLLFLAADAIFDAAAARRPMLGWILLGILATSLQVLAGYPQAVFMTAVAVGAYCLLRLVRARNRPRAVAALFAVATVPLLITAMQLWTGIEVGRESIRAGGGTYRFASAFSFPIENLLTLLAPAFFGDRMHVEYWGRWNYWDVIPFIGVVGLLLALYGAVFGRARRFSGVLALLMLVIAFGRYTPVHEWLYDYVPGFSLFRSPSKFLFHAALFAVMLAATGADDLIRRPRRSRGLAITATVLALTLGAGAAWVWQSPSAERSDDPWERIVLSEKNLEEVYNWLADLDEVYLSEAASLAALGLLIGAATSLALGVLLWFSPRSRYIVFAALALGVLEVFVFARTTRATFKLSDSRRDAIAPVYAACTSGERVLDVAQFDNTIRNYALKVRGRALWGYDPVVLKRYGEFMAYAGGGLWHAEELEEHVFTWGSDPFGVAVTLGFNSYTQGGLEQGMNFLRLLRTRYIIGTPVAPEYRKFVVYMKRLSGSVGAPPPRPEDQLQTETLYVIPGGFPEAVFMQDYRVMPADLDMLVAMMQANLGATVFLEAEPDPLPGAGSGVIAHAVTSRSTDHRTFQIDLPAPSIMLLTDSYSAGWRAVALSGSVQREYQVMPADYTLMAIPLAAGHHHFRLEYAPAGYRYGRWISLGSTLVFLGAAVYWMIARRRRAAAG